MDSTVSLNHDLQLRDFLQSLRDTGKIDGHEFAFALQLTSKLMPSGSVVIPGAVTLRKEIGSFNGLAAVSAVWNTAELAQNIFGHLSVRDLANSVALTCRCFRSYVHDTPRLRRELFLEPDYSYTSELPRCPEIKGVHYCVTPAYVECLITKVQDLMEQYPRLHNVYIMQPPPTSLDVTYHIDDGRHVALGHVENPKGLTYGYLWQHIDTHFKQWQQTRRTAPDAMPLRIIEAHLMLRVSNGDYSQDP